MLRETIFSLSSAQGKAGIAVIRISGPKSFWVASKFSSPITECRKTSLKKLYWDGELLDEALVIGFEHQKSFTGEQVVEFHVHGSVAVIKSILSALSSIQDLRPALPGEFTRRALENNCLDLTQVEGLSNLIQAETKIQQKQALKGYSGNLTQKISLWRDTVLSILASIEAVIDFVDEDITLDVIIEVKPKVKELIAELEHETIGAKRSERIHLGFDVALVGRPNVGKSTLLNYLAKRDLAITSEISGTTRDIIELKFDLDGFSINFLDMAGIGQTRDKIEAIGIEKAKVRALEADLRVFIIDDVSELGAFEIERKANDIVVFAKGDITIRAPSISGVTGMGIDELLVEVKKSLSLEGENLSLLSNSRQYSSVKKVKESLDDVFFALNKGDFMLELISEDLRISLKNLDFLLGRLDVEEVLGEIFSTFCVGK